MIWNRKELAVSLGVGGLGLAVLGLLSWYDFLLFHTVAELFSIVVAACVFIVTWNSRDNVDSTAYPLLGVAFLCIALLDGIHTLAYEGMPFFPAYDANLPTQLWIATRYLEALSLLGFVLLLGRRFPLGWPFAGYLLLTAGLVVLIFARLFPDCFVPGHGLTAFKIGSEYLICLLLITTLGLLRKQKEMFEPRLYALLQLSLTGTVLAELAFTFYVSTYGLSNLIGHYFKIISFYLIYKAVVATGLSQPQDLLFRKLRQSEERYDSLTRNLQGIAFRCRFDWTPVYIRGSVEAITGYYEQEFLDQNITWAGLVHDQDKEFFYDPELFAALQSEAGCSRKREYRIVRRDGHIRWLYESMHNVVGFGGIPTCIEGVRLDITEKKQNELELKKLWRSVQNSPMSIVITDLHGIIEYVNPAFSIISGYSREEAVGQNPSILKSGEHDKSFYRSMWDVLSKGQTWRGEICNRKKDGRLFWEQAAIAPVRDERGEITHYVAVTEDITGKKDLERLKADVDRIMRHDLKSPLNGLIGMPQVLLMEDNLTAQQRDMLASIEQSGRTMLRMIDQSLDMFKMEMGNYQYTPYQVNLLAVFFQLLADNQPRISAFKVPVAILVDGVRPQSDSEVVIGSEERLLYPMLSNLVLNAVEASPPRAEVRIDISTTYPVHVRISNQGAVPESVRNTFFEKYVTWSKKGGTGLGTYSAQLAARTMGYELWMEASDEQDMTWITIAIPAIKKTDLRRQS